jgi:Zn finger protein HypA/HybF involved in hydrogenase expression
MHEFSIIESLVERITQRCVESAVDKVALIRLRRCGAFSEEALYQAFSTFTVGTPLERKRHDVETNDHLFECDQCGYRRRITHDDLVGNVFVCRVFSDN